MGAIVIALVNLVAIYGWIIFGKNPAMAVATVGIVTFLGLLPLADYVSPPVSPTSVSTGEMRTSITGAIIVVFLVMFALTSFSASPSPEGQLSLSTFQLFKDVVMTVIIFYFGSKGVLQALPILMNAKKGGGGGGGGGASQGGEGEKKTKK